MPAALTAAGGWTLAGLPPLVRRAGPRAGERLVEFFTAQIRNANTRAAYGTAVTRFFAWCDACGLDLTQISPIAVATDIDALQATASAPTVKQHLAAIRHLFDYLVVGQVVPTNPAASIREPTHIVRTGKTPVLQPAEARLLLASIDGADRASLRDRALLPVMALSGCEMSIRDNYVSTFNVIAQYSRARRLCDEEHFVASATLECIKLPYGQANEVRS